MDRNYLIVDLGTGNTRVALVTSGNKILGIRTFTNTYYTDNSYEDARYFLPKQWQERILSCCRELCEEFENIQIHAVTSAGARQSIVLFDRKGNAFLGLPNIDNRGRAYLEDIPEKEEIYRISGKWVTEDFGASKLLGFKEKYPDKYKEIEKISSISEWIGSIFTKEIVIEPSQACEMQLYDIHKCEWSQTICSYYGIEEEIFPRICPAGTIVGSVLPEYRSQFHMAEEAVFIIGGADTQTALRQTGLKTGEIAIVSGTTSPVVTLSSKPFYDEKQRVWVDLDLKGNSYLIETNPGTTGLNYQRARNMLLPDFPYDLLEKAYEEKTDFGCTASFSSLLFSSQRALKNGGFFMKAPLEETVDKVDLLWAVLADIACSIYEQFSNLCQLTGNNDFYIWGCGGGFQSRTLCQMISDLTGRELRLLNGFEQATVRGLISLCNEVFNEDRKGLEKEFIVYFPKKEQLIHSYFPLWLKNRNQANCLEPEVEIQR